MTKKIYLGSFNNDNKKLLQDKAMDYLKQGKGDKFYYILPNGSLLKKYRQSFINSLEGTFELNLFTFDDVVNEIIGSSHLKSINHPMKSLIIRNILNDLSKKGKLDYYKDFVGMKGFVESCINIILEIKRSLITPIMYLDKCPDKNFFKEMGLIFKEYENVLQEKALTDRESDYLNSISMLEERPEYMDNLEFIIIDEFYDFRPVEIEIIKRLATKNIDIYVNMPFGVDSNNIILNKSLDKLKKLGFVVEPQINEPNNIFENLGQRLFTYDDSKFDFIDNIEVIKSPSSYLELKKIFREIKKHISEGIKLEDISLVILSNSYLNNLYKVSKEESLPLRISKNTSLRKLPLVKEFLNIVKTRISNGGREDTLNRIKSSYFPICDKALKENLEYIVRGQSFSNVDELKGLLTNSKKIKLESHYISDFNNLIENISNELESINIKDNITTYNNYFLKVINKFQVTSVIIEKYNVINEYEIFHRDLSSLERLKDLLHKMEEISLIEKEMTLEDYYLILEDYIAEEEITKGDKNLNGLNVLTPIMARGLNHKILFIAGLSQEEYPSLKNSSFFLSDDNQRILRGIGIEFMDYQERFSNEALKFAALISSCKDKVYMSFSENSLEEGKDIPSIFLDEVLSRIKGENIEEKVNITNIEMDLLINSNIEMTSCPKDFTNTLLNKYYLGDKLDEYIHYHQDKYKDVLDRINKITSIEMKRSQDGFNEYKGLLSDTKISSTLNTTLSNKTYSITYLESYSKCPYYFMLNTYFKIEEMERFVDEFSAIDIGTIYHSVLYSYYNKYRGELSNIIEFVVEDTLNYLREITFKHAAMSGFNKDKNKDLLIIENIYIRLSNFIKEDILRLNSEGIIPWAFEVEFDNEKLNLRGKIDRIDKLSGKDKYIVIDYKSSSYGKRDLDHIMSGLSQQLPVYILSQEDKDVIAGSYITLSDSKYFNAIGVLGEADFITKRQKGALDRTEYNDVLNNSKTFIATIIDKINDGDFSVNPLECSEYCSFKDICRYEDRKEEE